jgi:hypothetical protein
MESNGNSGAGKEVRERRPFKDLTPEEKDQLAKFLEPIHLSIKQWLAATPDAPDDAEPFTPDTERTIRGSLPPASLLAQGQWVLWRWETVKGKLTKVPYRAVALSNTSLLVDQI